MMSVGLHPRIVGRPARTAALRKFLEYATSKSEVWFATREEIAGELQSDSRVELIKICIHLMALFHRSLEEGTSLPSRRYATVMHVITQISIEHQ